MPNSAPTALILAGGFGTRLRSVVSDRPKPLAEIGDKPFLLLVLKQLADIGIKHCVISTGYMAELVEKTLGSHYKEMEIRYSAEDTPLGTAGALRHALPLITSDCALILNGDSYCDFPLNDFLKLQKSRSHAASLALIDVEDTSRYGRVEKADDNKITAFREKGISGPGTINSGIYLLPRIMLEDIPSTKPCSLEKDVFPRWVTEGRLFGFPSKVRRFIDIGTPESFAEAQQLLRDL